METQTNVIKKALYKEKPIAKRIHEVNNIVVYRTEIETGTVEFYIPKNEAVNFGSNESAQLLIRWLSVFTSN